MFANTKSRNLAQEVCYGFFEKRKNPEKMVCSNAPFLVNASVCFHLAKKVSKMRLNYRPVPHLDPALRARLKSALQRPDLNPTTRAKIESVLKQQ